jgi:DNA-binding transcriptional MerR regulator/quercetin dioxygenase-like cupin family protein
MSYTVKQVAKISRVSVRTLHFYDETGLLKPAFYGSNGYRFYEEPQLLMLQQILFYRELGFELKRIKQVLGRKKFEKVAALKSHRKVLEKELGRQRTLIETIDKTIRHLKGTKKMKSDELFQGFSVAAGKDRFDEHITLSGAPHDCKLSAQDTGGAIAVFEISGRGGGWPRHLHRDQDEWVYVIDGELELEIASKRSRARAGESVFIPRQVPHAWADACAERPAKIINTYQPAGNMEDFFRELGKYVHPPIHEVLSFEEMKEIFKNHGMDVVGPPLVGEWAIENGMVVRTA